MALISNGELESFFSEMPNPGLDGLEFQSGDLYIPVDRKNEWVRFVSGIWWEELVQHWLEENDTDFCANFIIKREQTKSPDTETDLLVRCADGSLGAMECKVAVPKAAGSVDIVKLLNDLSTQFGKTKAALVVSPAFWWEFAPDLQENFRQACKLRNIEILETKEAIVDWVGVSKKIDYPSYFIEFPEKKRPWKQLYNEAKNFLGAWQDNKKNQFEELLQELQGSYPEHQNKVRELRQTNQKIQELKNKAYKSGAGSPKMPPLAELLEQAKNIPIFGLEEDLKHQFQSGQRAHQRVQNEIRRKC